MIQIVIIRNTSNCYFLRFENLISRFVPSRSSDYKLLRRPHPTIIGTWFSIASFVWKNQDWPLIDNELM